MKTVTILLFSVCALQFGVRPASAQHAIGILFDGGGSVLATGQTKYYTVPFACTINAWNMTALPVGSSATVDIWKMTNAYPTASDTITGSATPSISGFLPAHSTNLSGWHTRVIQNDNIGFHVSAISSAKQVSLVLQCQ